MFECLICLHVSVRCSANRSVRKILTWLADFHQKGEKMLSYKTVNRLLFLETYFYFKIQFLPSEGLTKHVIDWLISCSPNIHKRQSLTLIELLFNDKLFWSQTCKKKSFFSFPADVWGNSTDTNMIVRHGGSTIWTCNRRRASCSSPPRRAAAPTLKTLTVETDFQTWVMIDPRVTEKSCRGQIWWHGIVQLGKK